jgi:hypothetical protein
MKRNANSRGVALRSGKSHCGLVRIKGSKGDAILYLVAGGGIAKASKAGGDNPAVVLLAVLGGKPPQQVVVNELTTVASAFTAARFINGEAISGNRQ